MYPSAMKSAYTFKFFLAVALGVLTGEAVTRDYEKWHALGRDAFLANESHRFDRYMAHPGPGAIHILSATLFFVLAVALYEGFAFAGAKCVSLIVDTLRKP
jgi:hypothetical protein